MHNPTNHNVSPRCSVSMPEQKDLKRGVYVNWYLCLPKNGCEPLDDASEGIITRCFTQMLAAATIEGAWHHAPPDTEPPTLVVSAAVLNLSQDSTMNSDFPVTDFTRYIEIFFAVWVPAAFFIW